VDPAAVFPPHLAAELRNLRNRGVLLQAYSPGGPGAVLLLRVDDLDHATRLLKQLPLRTAGLIDIQLTGLHPIDTEAEVSGFDLSITPGVPA
jgi:muconolactone delta-isomerase